MNVDLDVPLEDYERWYRCNGKDHEAVEIWRSKYVRYGSLMRSEDGAILVECPV